MRRLSGLACLVMALLSSAPLFGGETGSISGVIRDSQGGVLPGVNVKVSGPQLPAGRDAVTGSNGDYFFQRLLPGDYKVEAQLSGMGKTSREIRVSVDVDSQINLTLSPQLSEEVTVTGATPEVDLRSSEVNFNYTAEVIKDLPLERSYKGLFQLIPGVADNRTPVGPNGGGSRQDNVYLIDGVNITNPGFGNLTTEVNELDIVEFNIKRGAISAEGGRAAGFVANAVTKSGTNELRGAARFEYMPDGLISDAADNRFRDTTVTTVLNPALGLGGPLVKDKLFWYGSARYFKEVLNDRQNQLGTVLPDREATGKEYFGKLTATPSQKHLINLSFRDRPRDVNFSSLLATSDPSVATTDDTGSKIASASWSYFPTQRTLVDVKYVYYKENNQSDPNTDLGYLPTPFNVANPAASGYYLDPTRGNTRFGGYEYSARVNYKRQELKASLGQFFDLGKTSHQVKVGAGYEFGEEDFFRLTNGWGDIQRVTVGGLPRLRARYYFEQAPQLGQGRTWSVFAQDTVTLGPRLTVNLGVLANKDEYAQEIANSGGCGTVNTPSHQPGGAAVFETDGDRCTFLRFGFGDEIQPRIGVNFNLREGKGDKIYANYGRYYNMDQKSSGRSLAPRRIFQREAIFDPVTGALISNVDRASTTGKLIDPALKPTYNDEYLVGYATPIGEDWAADLFYSYRNTKNFIEDVPSVLPATGPYAAANLPCAAFASCQGDVAKRKYQGVTVEVNRRMKDRWALNTSYTYSKFEGNFDLDYDFNVTIFNTSSFIQDGPGTNVQENGRYGPLRYDRPHVFKAFLTVEPVSRLTLGGYLRVQSGTPWNARAQDSQGGAALFYVEPAGAHRNPTWTNFDLLTAYRAKLSETTGLTLEARLLNAFNSKTRIQTNSVQYTSNSITSDPQPVITPLIDNPFFGTGNAFAPPRRLLLSATVDF